MRYVTSAGLVFSPVGCGAVSGVDKSLDVSDAETNCDGVAVVKMVELSLGTIEGICTRCDR